MSQKKVVCNSGKFVWSRELITNLIVLYEQHPVLYPNRDARELALQEICENLNRMHFTNLKVTDITKKNHGLRTNFFQEPNKIKKSESSGTSADAVYVPKWWCFDQMHFLRDHGVVVHQGSSNLAVEEDDSLLEEHYEGADVLYEGAVEELSDSLWFSPSSSKSQSRTDSRVSQNAEQHQKVEAQSFKRKRMETPRSRSNVTNTLQEVLTNATFALTELQTRSTASTMNSNHFFAQYVLILFLLKFHL